MCTGCLSQWLPCRMGSKIRTSRWFQVFLLWLAASHPEHPAPPTPITPVTPNIQLMSRPPRSLSGPSPWSPLIHAMPVRCPGNRPITLSSGGLSLSPCSLPLGRGHPEGRCWCLPPATACLVQARSRAVFVSQQMLADVWKAPASEEPSVTPGPARTCSQLLPNPQRGFKKDGRSHSGHYQGEHTWAAPVPKDDRGGRMVPPRGVAPCLFHREAR